MPLWLNQSLSTVTCIRNILIMRLKALQNILENSLFFYPIFQCAFHSYTFQKIWNPDREFTSYLSLSNYPNLFDHLQRHFKFVTNKSAGSMRNALRDVDLFGLRCLMGFSVLKFVRRLSQIRSSRTAIELSSLNSLFLSDGGHSDWFLAFCKKIDCQLYLKRRKPFLHYLRSVGGNMDNPPIFA